MSRQDRTMLDRLGPAGIERVLDGLLDAARLARLANAAGLSYPGIRTRSQKRETLLRDLAKRTLADAAAAREVVRALRKETTPRKRAWGALDGPAWEGRLADPEFLGDGAAVGAAAFLLAAGAFPAAPEGALDILLERPRSGAEGGNGGRPSRTVAAREDDGRERVRLDKKLSEAARKARHQSEQLRRARETERALRRDLMERKGELAEARMALERTRRELEALRGEPGPSTGEPDVLSAVASIDRAVRRLATAQRKQAAAVEDVASKVAALASRDAPATRDPGPLAEAIEGLRKDAAAERRAARREARARDRRLDDLGTRVEALDGRLAAALPRAEPRPARGKPHVGVFVDVQNVFYGARQLKGKLDFDALLSAAVRDRRLIVARAYVVEAKEIDQSGFIAVLEHRGIQVRRKTLQVRADGSMKGDWDMEMALDILDEADSLDVVALVSGDGDFASLVARVKAIGPRVEVLSFPRNTAKALIEAADDFHPLDRRFMIRAGRGGSRASAATGAAPAAGADEGDAKGGDRSG